MLLAWRWIFALVSISLCVSCAGRGGQGQGADRPTYSITMKVAEDLGEVRKHTQKKDWEGALAKLDKTAERSNLNPLEQATICAARAGVYLGKSGGLPAGDDLANIITNLEKAVAFDAMPMKDQLATEYNLGQTYFMAERFSEAADMFAKWSERAENPEAKDLFLVASAYAQVKKYDRALPFAKRAVEQAEKPEEPWLQLLVSVHFELKQEKEVAATLEKLAQAFPKKEHYLQLSATYSEIGDDAKALAALETVQSKGWMSEEREFLGLADLYSKTGSAAKGAAVIEAGMKNGKVTKGAPAFERLAACYLMGDDTDKAAAALAQAGDEASNGKLYFELGRAEIGRSRWEKAREALSQAIQRGGLDSAGEAQLLLGVAHFHAKSKAAALASLGEAKKHPQTQKCAEQWIAAVKAGKAGPASCGKAAEK
jgi:tetratricopeptide (TPR) repeat protein